MAQIARRAAALLALLALAGAGRAAAQQTQPQVSVGGVVYAQYLYQLKDTANHQNGFDVTRAYVNVVGKFQQGLMTRVTTDIYRAADSSTVVRLKYAYLAWTPEKSHLTYRFGLTQTPWLDYEETLWDYRMQGSMALDRNGYVTSSDFGAAVDGTWNQDKVNFQAGVYNGEGYSKGTGDQRKDVAARVSVRLLDTDDNSKVGGLRLTGFTDIGKPTSGGKRDRYTGQVSYRTKALTLAGEYTSATDTVTAPATAERKGSIVSAFGTYKVPASKVILVARVDVVDPNTSVSGDKQTRIIGGIAYQVTPNWRAMVDVDNLSYESTPTPTQEAKRSTLYFQSQLTF
ncbi:MAG TPA: hypothetical protein VFS28_03910 [Gemmatimonadales bacterium]|nr:hypothetical protein [Gemmatimonadales bacterium]